jgi:hypothetical protein
MILHLLWGGPVKTLLWILGGLFILSRLQGAQANLTISANAGAAPGPPPQGVFPQVYGGAAGVIGPAPFEPFFGSGGAGGGILANSSGGIAGSFARGGSGGTSTDVAGPTGPVHGRVSL